MNAKRRSGIVLRSAPYVYEALLLFSRFRNDSKETTPDADDRLALIGGLGVHGFFLRHAVQIQIGCEKISAMLDFCLNTMTEK